MSHFRGGGIASVVTGMPASAAGACLGNGETVLLGLAKLERGASLAGSGSSLLLASVLYTVKLGAEFMLGSLGCV